LLRTREPFSFTLIYRRFLAIRTFLLLLSQYFPSPNNHNLISFPLLKFLIYTLLILFKLMNQFSIILILPGVHTIVAPFFLYLPSDALRKLYEEEHAQFPCVLCSRLLYPHTVKWVVKNDNFTYPFTIKFSTIKILLLSSFSISPLNRYIFDSMYTCRKINQTGGQQ